MMFSTRRTYERYNNEGEIRNNLEVIMKRVQENRGKP